MTSWLIRLAAVAITERAAEQQQPGQRERIGVHDPLKACEADAEVLTDGGERDIDDRRVEDHEARAEHRDQQDPPPCRRAMPDPHGSLQPTKTVSRIA